MQTETPYAAQLESKLKAMTLSPAAAHWVAKALHPVTGAPAPIPDAIQVAALLPEYRTTTVIGAPGAGNWDFWSFCHLVILRPPGTLLVQLA